MMSKCVETRNARLKEFGSQLESAFLLTTTNIQVREMRFIAHFNHLHIFFVRLKYF